MQFSIFLEPIQEPGFEGWYYAHIPALDLTTQGQGIEGATAAAQDLVKLWVEAKRQHGESIPSETQSYITRIEVPDAALIA
jgi:predicted RNase H-like HicB family nuclease